MALTKNDDLHSALSPTKSLTNIENEIGFSRFGRDGILKEKFFATWRLGAIRESSKKFVRIRETCPEPVEGFVAKVLRLLVKNSRA